MQADEQTDGLEVVGRRCAGKGSPRRARVRRGSRSRRPRGLSSPQQAFQKEEKRERLKALNKR